MNLSRYPPLFDFIEIYASFEGFPFPTLNHAHLFMAWTTIAWSLASTNRISRSVTFVFQSFLQVEDPWEFSTCFSGRISNQFCIEGPSPVEIFISWYWSYLGSIPTINSYDFLRSLVRFPLFSEGKLKYGCHKQPTTRLDSATVRPFLPLWNILNLIGNLIPSYISESTRRRHLNKSTSDIQVVKNR